jgi:hypothetical protein
MQLAQLVKLQSLAWGASNDCYAPAGSPEGGQFCPAEGGAGEDAKSKGDKDIRPTMHFTKAMEKYRDTFTEIVASVPGMSKYLQRHPVGVKNLNEEGAQEFVERQLSSVAKTPSIIGGYYKWRGVTMYVRTEGMPASTVATTFRHELGHHINNVTKTVAETYAAFNKMNMNGTPVIKPYAKTNPAEYFACCFEAFLDPGKHASLKAVDPNGYGMVETVLEKMRKRR